MLTLPARAGPLEGASAARAERERATRRLTGTETVGLFWRVSDRSVARETPSIAAARLEDGIAECPARGRKGLVETLKR